MGFYTRKAGIIRQCFHLSMSEMPKGTNYIRDQFIRVEIAIYKISTSYALLTVAISRKKYIIISWKRNHIMR